MTTSERIEAIKALTELLKVIKETGLVQSIREKLALLVNGL